MGKLKNSDHLILSIKPGAKPLSIEQAPFRALLDLIDDSQASARLQVAFERLHLYSHVAAIQNERIWQAFKEYEVTALTRDREKAWYWLKVASVECHFYFTCRDCVRKILSSLASKNSGFLAPVEVWKKHSAVFKEYKVLRDHLEHYDERLPGGSRTDFTEDELGIEGSSPGVDGEGFFNYQDTRCDVRPSSVRLLHSIISELQTALRPELEASVQRHLERREKLLATRDK